jgi:hypothetical protein
MGNPDVGRRELRHAWSEVAGNLRRANGSYGRVRPDVRFGRFVTRIGAPSVSRVRQGSAGSPRTPEWKYGNVRRLFVFVEESIDQETHCSVLEPNVEPLLPSKMTQDDIDNG